MKKLILLMLTCTIVLTGCVSPANAKPKAEPLDLPVAKVSAEYSEDAMKIIKSFYNINAKDFISEDILNTPVIEQKFGENGKVIEEIEYQAMADWCFKPGGIDFYTYTWGQGAEEIRNGKTIGYVLDESQKASDLFYTEINLYLLLSKDGIAVAEGVYGGGVGQNYISWMNFYQHPTSSLFLDDVLMKALKDEGFDTSSTIAKSCFISGHSVGIYFSDGKIERYYTQMYLLDGIEEIMELKAFYTPEEFADLLEKGADINAKNWGL